MNTSMRRLKIWVSLRNDCARRPGGYLPATKLRARERARLWISIVRQERSQ